MIINEHTDTNCYIDSIFVSFADVSFTVVCLSCVVKHECSLSLSNYGDGVMVGTIREVFFIDSITFDETDLFM